MGKVKSGFCCRQHRHHWLSEGREDELCSVDELAICDWGKKQKQSILLQGFSYDCVFVSQNPRGDFYIFHDVKSKIALRLHVPYVDNLFLKSFKHNHPLVSV